MPATYEPIATTTLGAAASTITFSSIPATYTDLRVVVCGSSSSGNTPRFRFNSDTGNNYSATHLNGDGASAGSQRDTNASSIFTQLAFVTTPIIGLITLDVFSYAGSTNKTALITMSADANGSGSVHAIVGLWRNTGAINSIELSAATNFTSGTTATIYGIKAA